jgi:hypothetical protein
MISGVEVVEEAARLIKQIRFSANRPAYREGKHVAVCVDPRWSADNRTIDVLITCYALGHQDVDWEGLRVNIERREDERSVTWLSFLNARGQSTRNELPVEGEYSLSLPYRVKSQVAERVLSVQERQIRSRGSIQLTDKAEERQQQSRAVNEEALAEPNVREGHTPDGSIQWIVKETADEQLEIYFEAQEELAGGQIAVSLVEATTGCLQLSGILQLIPAGKPGRWEGRFSLGPSAGVNRPCNLVFEPLPPSGKE